MKKVAILGGTSHIAKGLIYNFSQKDGYEFFLFKCDPKVMDRLVEHVLRQPIGDSRIVNYNKSAGTVAIEYRARESNTKKSNLWYIDIS